MMQALQIVELGELVMNTVPVPHPAKGQVLIKQRYAGLNFMDPMIMKTNIPFNFPLPLTIGWDVCGTVTEVGEGVTKFAVGDEVFGATFNGGGFAQFAVASESNIAKRINLPADKAAACGIIFGTLHSPLYLSNNLDDRKGQTIFIPGGGGAIGHLVVQMAKNSGLTVIASASKPESIKVAKDSGADHVIDYSKHNVVEEVLKLTNQRGVDVVFDTTYIPESFIQGASVIAKGGMWIRVGNWNHAISCEEARKIVKERGAEASFGGFGSADPDTGKGLALLDQLYLKGIAPIITKVLPFDAEAVTQAEKENAQRKFFGKAVIKIEQ